MEAQYKSASSEVRQDVRERLRSRFPYMKDETLEKFLAKVEDGCNQFLTEQDSEQRDTKSRISIFSLSAELRNSIYELALKDVLSYRLGEHNISGVSYRRPGLLAANKQIRCEALPMYHGTTLHGHVANFTEIDKFMDGLNAETSRIVMPHFETVKRKSNIRAYLQAIGTDQARLIKCFRLELQETSTPSTKLERMITDGDLDNEWDVEQLLEGLGVLDLGVPRDAWRLQTVCGHP